MDSTLALGAFRIARGAGGEAVDVNGNLVEREKGENPVRPGRRRLSGPIGYPRAGTPLYAMFGCLIYRDLRNVMILAFSRSEEHTSELQSRPHLVCRLLL